jgi:hypothetical protein
VLSPDKIEIAGDYYRYELHRVATLPRHCVSPGDRVSRGATFDAFWHYMNENYASFRERGVNWDSLGAVYRPLAERASSDSALYALMGDLVRKVNDPHVFVTNRKSGPGSISYGAITARGLASVIGRATPHRPRSFHVASSRTVEQGIESIVRMEVLGGDFHSAFNDKITWGLAGGTGYLRLSLFTGLFTGRPRDAMIPALDSALDVIFTALGPANGLVIDVTTNTGGADFIPLTIARRLISSRRVVWVKRGRTLSGWNAPLEVAIEPSPRPGFKGPIVVMASGNTVSAGETMVTALRGLPDVTIYGTRTMGAHSDIQMLPLPDGGAVGLANERLTNAKGESFEVTGIPPDIEVTIFDPARPITGFRDAALGAIQLARRRE